MNVKRNGVHSPEMTIINDLRKSSSKDINGKQLMEKSISEEEDLLWHEQQVSRKRFIKGKIDEYIQGFTVHGLSKVFTGSKIEKVFWFTMLCAGVILSVYVIHGLVTKFFRYEVYTEIRAQITEENLFPSVSICEYQLLRGAYFSYCGGPAGKSNRTDLNETCWQKLTEPAVNVTSSPGVYWSNGLFNITKCFTWDGKQCATDEYFKTLHHFNHACVTWNYNGDLYDLYSHVDIAFHFNKPQEMKTTPFIIAVPHDCLIHELDITKKVDMELGKNYQLKLDKMLIKRLPSPFPSNCTRKKTGDIFPGKYTRRSCIESQNYISMYKKCGGILDYVQRFIPADILRKYKQNRTIGEIIKCISRFKKIDSQNKECAFPCEELELGMTTTFHERQPISSYTEEEKSTYKIDLQFQSVDTYKIMEEKELYSWDQMACEIGGLIGLVIGASVLSLIEIFAYILLVIAKKFV